MFRSLGKKFKDFWLYFVSECSFLLRMIWGKFFMLVVVGGEIIVVFLFFFERLEEVEEVMKICI